MSLKVAAGFWFLSKNTNDCAIKPFFFFFYRGLVTEGLFLGPSTTETIPSASQYRTLSFLKIKISLQFFYSTFPSLARMVSHSDLKNNKQTNRWCKPQTETDLPGSIPTRTFCFVLFFCLYSCFSWKQILRTKEKPETKTPEARAAQKGLQARRTGFSAVGWVGPSGSGPAPTCNAQRLEAASVGMNHQVRPPWTEGRAVGGRGEAFWEDSALMGERLILQTQRVAFLAGTGTTNLRWGRGLNKTGL